jgi:hypothetical protein
LSELYTIYLVHTKAGKIIKMQWDEKYTGKKRIQEYSRIKCSMQLDRKIKPNKKSNSGNKLIITLRSTLIYESEYSRIESLMWTRRCTRTMGGEFGIRYSHILCITRKLHIRPRR